jgi:tetratricopeptide (TPR) repeat protein
MMSQGQESIQYFNQALEIAHAIGDRQGEVSHLGSLGMAWVDKAEQAKNLPGEALVHPNIIMRNTMPDGSLPRYLQEQIEGQDASRCLQKAATYFEQAVSIAREVGDYPAECRELGNLGTVLSRQGKIERALSCYQRALQIAGELGDRQREVEQLENMRSAYLSLANESEAHRIEAELALISQNGGQPDTKSILDRFGSKEVDPFYEEYWKVSSEEDNKRYWSDYYQANIGG